MIFGVEKCVAKITEKIRDAPPKVKSKRLDLPLMARFVPRKVGYLDSELQEFVIKMEALDNKHDIDGICEVIGRAEGDIYDASAMTNTYPQVSDSTLEDVRKFVEQRIKEEGIDKSD